MTSKISSNRSFQEFREVYFWSLKKNRGMAALLSLLIFLVFPMILLLTVPRWLQEITNMQSAAKAIERLSREQVLLRNFSSFLKVMVPLILALVLLFAIILCVQLFDYMQKKRSVDLFHSLPISRTSMLLGRWCAGLTVLFAPVLLNFIIVEITRLAYGIPVESAVSAPLVRMLWIFLIGITAFTFCMFMSVCSGTMLDTVLSILGVNIGYPVLVLCSFYIAMLVVPGLVIDYGSNLTVITAVAPFAAVFVPLVTNFSEEFTWFPFWYIIFTIALLVGSVLLYRRRKSESAENNFAFPIPKIIIRFILTAVGGMGFGLVLEGISGGFLIGVLAGSLIAHVIVEAVYSRGFKQMKKSFRWYGAFAAAFVLFFGILATGLLGYDTRVPNTDDISYVTVKGPNEYVNGGGTNVIYDENNRYLTQISPVIFDKNSIKTVTDAHRRIIGLMREKKYPYYISSSIGGGKFTISYHLKNGRTVTRGYPDANYNNSYGEMIWDEMNTQYEKITSLQEYIQGIDMIFHVDPSDVKSVDVSVSNGEPVTYVPDETVKAQLVAALRDDIGNKMLVTDNLSEDKSKGGVNLRITYKDSIKQDLFVKSQAGYEGKISLLGGGSYWLTNSNSKTYQLIEKLGWNK